MTEPVLTATTVTITPGSGELWQVVDDDGAVLCETEPPTDGGSLLDLAHRLQEVGVIPSGWVFSQLIPGADPDDQPAYRVTVTPRNHPQS